MFAIDALAGLMFLFGGLYLYQVIVNSSQAASFLARFRTADGGVIDDIIAAKTKAKLTVEEKRRAAEQAQAAAHSILRSLNS